MLFFECEIIWYHAILGFYIIIHESNAFVFIFGICVILLMYHFILIISHNYLIKDWFLVPFKADPINGEFLLSSVDLNYFYCVA
jgi:hypothetical protein